jgi:hypothetical protein
MASTSRKRFGAYDCFIKKFDRYPDCAGHCGGSLGVQSTVDSKLSIIVYKHNARLSGKLGCAREEGRYLNRIRGSQTFRTPVANLDPGSVLPSVTISTAVQQSIDQ